MSSSNQSVLERLFNLNANQTNVRTEIMAGVTTFLAMCYIIIVNPLILGETGMDMGAVFVATCIASAIGCFVMGFVGNYPIALAPGMGLNAYFTFAVVKGMGVDWRVALGAVFISGIIFILFSFFKVREMLVNALPMGLKMSIACRRHRPLLGIDCAQRRRRDCGQSCHIGRFGRHPPAYRPAGNGRLCHGGCTWPLPR
jgi:MFS transporter, purine transporter family